MSLKISLKNVTENVTTIALDNIQYATLIQMTQDSCKAKTLQTPLIATAHCYSRRCYGNQGLPTSITVSQHSKLQNGGQKWRTLEVT